MISTYTTPMRAAVSGSPRRGGWREKTGAGSGNGAGGRGRRSRPGGRIGESGAHRLGLSHSTVKHHRARARSKVGASTTVQLVWILAERLPEPEGGPPND